MGRWGPTPNPSQEGNGEMGRWGERCRVGSAYQQDCEVLNWY
ncbi:hypothetical protein [Moorena sp. SIO1F2]|nr:hypothetical protein [Moorena sp. SIO1F2]